MGLERRVNRQLKCLGMKVCASGFRVYPKLYIEVQALKHPTKTGLLSSLRSLRPRCMLPNLTGAAVASHQQVWLGFRV